jgi:solute carrier family 25 (adenine nucleotide translocator) protein 4/5/6/31
VSFFGISIFRGTYFGIYDSFKTHRYHELEKWFLSYLSYVTATFLTYPTDTVRRRMIMTSCASYKYKGFVDCFQNIVRQEGVMSLFRGGNIIFLQACSGSTIYYIFDKLFTDSSSQQ